MGLNNRKKILITGGAGFIGRHLVNTLSQQNAEITIVDRSVGYSSDNIEYCCADIEIYLLDVDNLAQFEMIFHLAGNSHPMPSVNDPLMDFNLNLKVSILLLEALRKNGAKTRLINVSSAAIYGNPETLPIAESHKPSPLSPYGVSKLAVEQYVNVYSRLYNVQGISVRPFSVYGPGLYKQVVYDLIRKVLTSNNKIDVYGDGTQLRDFIYIDDLVNAMILVAQKGTPGEVYNIASGKSHSINEVITAICMAMNIHPEIRYSGTVRSGEPDKWTVDISKISRLGFNPETILTDGIAKTVEWLHTITK